MKIYLDTKEVNIEEIVLQKKKNFINKEIIGETKEANIGVTSLIGYETCVFLENKYNKIGKIKRVYINLKNRKNAQYIAMFNIKFYEYDEVNNLPGKELYNKNIFVNPKNKKYRFWVDVENLNVKLPEKGICIGVEMINNLGKVDKYTKFGPMFRYTMSPNNNITWSNYHNRGWKNGSIKNNIGYANPMIGLEVLFP